MGGAAEHEGVEEKEGAMTPPACKVPRPYWAGMIIEVEEQLADARHMIRQERDALTGMPPYGVRLNHVAAKISEAKRILADAYESISSHWEEEG